MKKLLNLICLFLLTMFIINCSEVKAEENEDKLIAYCEYKISGDMWGGLFEPLNRLPLFNGIAMSQVVMPNTIYIRFNRDYFDVDSSGTLNFNYINEHDFKKSDILQYYDNSFILSGNHGECPSTLYAKNRKIYMSEKDRDADSENKRLVFNDSELGLLDKVQDVISFFKQEQVLSLYANYVLDYSVYHPENDTNPPNSTSDDPTISEINDCVTLLGSPKTEGTPAYYVSVAFRVVKYVAVGLLIVLSTIDLISAIMSQDKEILNKTATKIVKRFVLCVVIFVLPIILDLVLQYINDSQYLEQVKLGLCGIGE